MFFVVKYKTMPRIKRPKIATITAVGQFPNGMPLHIRNLKWFLSGLDYHIYILTRHNFHIDDPRVTVINRPNSVSEFTPSSGFINFYTWLGDIVKKIHADWFLFMEQDIWFYDKFDSFPPTNTIKSFFPVQDDYHCVTCNDSVIHPRVWEGAQLIHNSIVRRAAKYGVDFSNPRPEFIAKLQADYSHLGKIGLKNWSQGDTMDEFTLYCGLVDQTKMSRVRKSVHIRGAETVHRHHPHIYYGASNDEINHIKDKIWYLDIYEAIALFYLAGNWNGIHHLDWKQAKPRLFGSLDLVSGTAHTWMTGQELKRLHTLTNMLRLPSDK